MKTSSVVGKTAYYRPLYQQKFSKSKVLSSVRFMKMDIPNNKEDSMAFKNTGEALLTLANEDEVLLSQCYFDRSTESARA